MVAVMTVLALRAIPPSPQSGVFPWRAGWERRTDAGSWALVIRLFLPEPLQNVVKSIVFYMPPSATAGALSGTCASRAQQKKQTLLLVGDLTRRTQRGGLEVSR